MNKKADFGFSNIIMIIIAIIGGLLIISIVAYILGAFTDPNRIEDGIGCRIMIQSTARIESATQGIITADSLLEACKVIEKTIPMKSYYQTLGGNVNRMTAGQFREVVMYDFAELINNAWWISGEGDRSEYFIKNILKLFAGENKCYILYTVKIHAPNKRIADNFNSITRGVFISNMKNITRADIKGGLMKGDQRSILTYITLDGKGSGVQFKTMEENEGVIEVSKGGTDAIYAIAVGFYDDSGIGKFFQDLFKGAKMPVKNDASFIYIAPFDEVAKICTVSN